jgi:hypothetical protein
MSESEEETQEATEESFGEWITSPQMLVSLSAVLLSLCGLFVSLYETSIMREEQYASVWPHVEIGPSVDGNDLSLAFRIQNTGVGPANIKAAYLEYNGEIINNWREIVERFTEDENYFTGSINLVNGSVLPPRSDQESIYAFDADTSSVQQELFYEMRNQVFEGNLNINICYCSVYDQCWTANMQNSLKRYRGEKALSKGDLKVQSCKDFPVSGI